MWLQPGVSQEQESTGGLELYSIRTEMAGSGLAGGGLCVGLVKKAFQLSLSEIEMSISHDEVFNFVSFSTQRP